MNGIIFDIKRFAVHDGGGIRSTLFLKGCPLRCPWCQNPEGLHRNIQLWHQPTVCIRCGGCITACPQDALRLDGRIHIDRDRCTSCGLCVERCPAAAMMLDGQIISDEQAADLLLRDRLFFERSGGITLSGGEVLQQAAFAQAVLKRCKDAGVDTAIETCLYADQETVASLLPLTDHFLVDIKYLDPQLHAAHVGASNRIILENYEFLVRVGADVLVRTPLIPGYTATEDNIRGIAHYVAATDPSAKYELLNFNPLCRSKYNALERPYPVIGTPLPPDELDRFYDILRKEGIPTIIKE